MDLDKLADLLADRLVAIVPAGFHIQVRDGNLWYSCDPGRFPGQLGDYRVGQAASWVRDAFGAGLPVGADDIATIARLAIDNPQDYVDEASHDPWPGERTPPQAHAQVRGQLLHIWYSERDDPGQVILACAPIALAGIATD